MSTKVIDADLKTLISPRLISAGNPSIDPFCPLKILDNFYS